MSKDRSRPSVPAWKQVVPKAERKDKTRPAWRREPKAATAPSGGLSRGSRLGLGAVGLIAASAALVAVILWLRPHKPACLVLLGADYIQTADGKSLNLAIPHNAYGWQSLKGIAQTTDEVVHVKHAPAQLRRDDLWTRDLDTVREKTIIIYLAMHGGADLQGPYLLSQDTDLGAPDQQRLRLDDVFKRLKELPDDKKKLLLLDVTQVASCWTLGMLHNDFARALQTPEIVKRIETIPNLVVVCASNVDQRSWISPEWRSTIFAHFVSEALRGAADSDNNGRVTALELADYVKTNVERWTRANWGALQTPFLLGGDERARKIELANTRSYQSVNSNDTPASRNPADLSKIEKAWQDCQKLEQSTPPPMAYAPQLWREYVDGLLLYEQLIRAGHEERLEFVKEQVDHLADSIRRAGPLPLPSMQNAAAMPAALGLSVPWDSRSADRQLLALWDAPVNQRPQVFERLNKQAADAQSPQLLRLQLSGLLVDRLARNDPSREDLKTGNELLHVIGALGNARPAEAHFLAMLLRDLSAQKPPPERAIGQALEVRRLAEDCSFGVDPKHPVHPYSERVFPWIQAKIEQADERRQQGQDLLFATQRESWDKAAQLLLEARDEVKPGEGYLAARKDAARIQEALAVCQHVFAALPYYSRWLAERQSTEKTPLDTAEELWKETHYLARLLRGDLNAGQRKAEWIRTPVSVDANDVPPRNLEDRTRAISKSFKSLEDSFAGMCRRLAAPASADLQAPWREIEEALAVPAIKADQRLALLQRALEIAHKFHEETADTNRLPIAQISPDDNLKEAADHAQRQGRLALAALGMRWFDDTTLFETNDRYTQVHGLIEKLVAGDNWSKPALQAGEQIALRWQRLPEQINRLTDKGRKEKLEQAEVDLGQAEDLARQMDGGQVVRLTGNPVDASRRLRLHNLLLWQARRTLQDHWFPENQTDVAYYQFAGNLFTRDARTLIEAPRGELSAAQTEDRMRAVVAMQDQLRLGMLFPALAGGQRPELTTEQQVPLTYQLKPDGWLPEGYPVVWLADDKLLHLPDEASRGRRVLRTDGKGPTAAESFTLESAPQQTPARSPRIDVANVRFQGRYRGQVINLATPINIHRLPDTVVYENTRPALAALAVRADADMHDQFAPRNGAIAIVLDCTGSMNMSKADLDVFKPYNSKTPCKWHDATAAVRNVLKDLQKGTTVSLWVFGHARGRRNKDGYPLNDQPNPKTDPLATLQEFRKPKEWDVKELDPLIDELNELFPFNETPLLRAMHEVKEKGFPSDFKGFKSLVVITDGEDNCFQSDNALHMVHGTSDIEQFILKDFDGSGVRPIVVGFKIPQDEQAQLKKIKDALKKLPLTGQYFPVENVTDLAKKLRTYMQQQFRFQIERDGGGSATPDLLQAMPEFGFDISRTDENDKSIFLRPGAYRVRIATQKPIEQRVQLDPGDFLRLKVLSGGFERVRFANDYPSKPRRETEGWILTIPQNRVQPPEQKLEMMLALETSALAAPTLKEVRPMRVWLEVKPQDTEQRIALRWGEMAGYAAPAWDIRVSEWPARPGASEPARPVVKMWWNQDNATAGSVDSIVRDGNADIASFNGKQLKIGADATDQVVIENVQVENQSVEGAKGAMETVPALVVRLRYPSGKPAWVEIEGPRRDGMEHRFYLKANKCTSVFWPISAPTANDLLRALRVYSVDKLKAAPSVAAEVQLENLPSEGERRPPSVFGQGPK